MANVTNPKLYGGSPDYKTISGSNRVKKGGKRKKKGK